MNTLQPWAARIIAALFVASTANGMMDTSCSLPWTVSREAYRDVPNHVFQTLMQCPEGLHGCSEELTSCAPLTRAVTCSCAANCKAYGDCCWNVEHDGTPDTETRRISCVAVPNRKHKHFQVYVVSGCPTAWPHDDVRAACEGAESRGDEFYLIPVTSASHVTYRNGLCALCNNDTINATFWSYAWDPNENESLLFPPEFTHSRPAHYLRPCVDDVLTDTCSQEVPEIVKKKCEMYYAPVTKDYPNGATFKNVYCAMCNGVNMSNLSCSPPRNFVMSLSKGFPQSSLAALFKPVIRTLSCYAEHNGRCYIQRESEPRRRDRRLNGNNNETFTKLPSQQAANNGSVRQYVTLISVSLSICCLALKLIVFCAYRESRSFASKCTLCLSITLMLTQILYLITSCLDLPTIACVAGAVLVHYGFLSTFCWTCVLSFDICRSLTALKLSSARESIPVMYSIFSCGLPLLVAASALAVDLAVPGTVLSPSYGRLVCWIGTFWGLVVYFLVPVAMLLLCCLLFYLRVVFYVSQTSLAQNTVSGVRNRQRAHAILFVRLALVMGSPWVIAFVGTFVDSAVLDCVVNVLVGLQGVYLFLGFKDYRHFWSSIRKCARFVQPSIASRSFPTENSLAKHT